MSYKHVLFVETLLCAAVGTASHQYRLEAGTVCGDRTVYSCRHSKSSAWIRNIVLCTETVLYAAVGRARYQQRLEACTVYGDPTVCSCRHGKSSV